MAPQGESSFYGILSSPSLLPWLLSDTMFSQMLRTAGPGGRTLAHAMAKAGDELGLRALHTHGAALLVATDDDGRSPAWLAALESDQAVALRSLRVLHELEAVPPPTHHELTALFRTGRDQVARLLLELGCLSAANLVAYEANSGLIIAGGSLAGVSVFFKKASMLHVLAEAGAAETLIRKDSQGRTAVHCILMDEDSIRALHALSPAGALSACDDKGRTAAHVAAERNGSAAILRALAQLGAGDTLTAVDSDGRTPLLCLWRECSLVDYGGDEPDRSCLTQCLVALHELCGVNALTATDQAGATVVHLAANSRGSEDFIRRVADLGGADLLTQQDSRGHTPALWAARSGHVRVLSLLDSLGADLSRAAPHDSAAGVAPAHAAAAHGYTECLRVISTAGGSLTVSDELGWTPAHEATYTGTQRLPEYYAPGVDHAACLRLIQQLGPPDSLTKTTNGGLSLAHTAASGGNAGILQTLVDLGLGASLAAVDNTGRVPAFGPFLLCVPDAQRRLHL